MTDESILRLLFTPISKESISHLTQNQSSPNNYPNIQQKCSQQEAQRIAGSICQYYEFEHDTEFNDPAIRFAACGLVSLKSKQKSLISRALGMGEEILFAGKVSNL